MKVVSFVVVFVCLASSPISYAAPTVFTVGPDESIQAAVDRAEAGDRIEVLPGVYHQSVTIEKEGVTFVGLKSEGLRAILDGEGERADGLRISGDNVTVTGFALRHFVGSGVTVGKVKGVVIRDLNVSDAGRHGVYSVECRSLLVERCVVNGNSDVGIFVGKCHDAVIRDNEIFESGTGIRIENSLNTLIENNSSHHNSVGVAVFCRSQEGIKISEHCRVINNRFIGNVGGTDSGAISGMGILIVAADHTEVAGNVIRDNSSFGIAVMSLLFGSLFGEGETSSVDPNADYTYIHGNAYLNNGGQASDAFKKAFEGVPGVDLFWDETGKSNQWQEPNTLTQFPTDLIKKQAGAHTNVIEFH